MRALAERVGIGKSQTHPILAEADWKPHQVRSWLTTLDPQFDTKQADVCGLYLKPPENAIVISMDEKTSIQARSRSGKELPMKPGNRPAASSSTNATACKRCLRRCSCTPAR